MKTLQLGYAMTIESYAEAELKRTDEYNGLHEIIRRCLHAIGEEGHSGASMGVYLGMLTHWLKDPQEPPSNSLHMPLWREIKTLDEATRKRVLTAVKSLCAYKPLTPITDTPEEWMEVYADTLESAHQHRRMPSIFRNHHPDGRVTTRWLDGKILYEPTDSYTDFVGFTSSDHPYEVTFPFHPDTPPVRLYFADRDRKVPITDDPEAWLSQARDRFYRGYDPITGKLTREAVLYWAEEHKQGVFLEAFVQLQAIVRAHPKKEDILSVFSESLYLHPRSRHFHVWFPYGTNKDADAAMGFYLKDYAIVRNLIRLVHENDYQPMTVDQIHKVPVWVPTKHYQDWEESPRFVAYQRDKQPIYLDLEINRIVAPDARQAHLYRRCKEKGLKLHHPVASTRA